MVMPMVPSAVIHSCSFVYLRSVGYGMSASGSWPLAARFSLFAFRCFFRTLIKRRRYHLRFHTLAADFDFYGRTNRRLRGRNIGQCDVLLQKRRWRSAGDIADLASGVVQDLVSVTGDSAIDHFEAHQRFLQAFGFR